MLRLHNMALGGAAAPPISPKGRLQKKPLNWLLEGYSEFAQKKKNEINAEVRDYQTKYSVALIFIPQPQEN